MRALPGMLAASLALAVASAAPVARADPAADLEKAHNAYVAREYGEAEARLRSLLDPKTGTLVDPDAIADARMYLGAVLVAQKRTSDAEDVFERLLIEKPDYQPDPLRVALEAVDAFTDAKGRIRAKLEAIQAEKVKRQQEAAAQAAAEKERQALRLAMLEKLAATEVVVEHHSRLVAAIPFGAGQFQNGQAGLGWTFAVGEGLLAAGSVIATIVTAYDVGQTSANSNYYVKVGYNTRAQTAAEVGDVFAGAFFIAALAGIAQAEIAFVPEVVTQKRREIPAATIMPVLGPMGVGVVGRF